MDNNEWEKEIGLTLNPSGDDKVNAVKQAKVKAFINSLLAARDEYWKGQLKELQRRFDTNTLT